MVKAFLCAALNACAVAAQAASATHSAPNFAIEAELSPKAVYVGAEAVLRVRLLRSRSAAYAVVRPPAVLGDAANVFSLEDIRWSQVVRDGATWDVHERAYLVVPRRAGRIAIPGAELDGPLRHALMSDPRGAPAPEALRGPSLSLEVRSVPPQQDGPWLPARLVTLEESWSRDPDGLSAGTAVTRMLTLRAEGVPAQRLPRIEMTAQPALRVHHDKAELATDLHASGTVGRRVQRVVLVPLDEGEVLLPELRVPWWDVHADIPRVAVLPARKLRLRAASAQLEPTPTDSPIAVEHAAAVAFVMMLAGWLWWRARTQAVRDVRAQLRKACAKNDPRAARDALVQWWSAFQPDRPAPLLQQIGEAWDDAAQAELWALDAALYARRPWAGKEFWRQVRPWLRKRRVRRAHGRAAGAGFFRLQRPG